MSCRTARADSTGRPFRDDAISRVVLLVFVNHDLRARFAYQLAAAGFNVVTDIDGLRGTKPDVIVAELDAAESGRPASIPVLSDENGPGGIPVIAVAGDVGDSTQTRARQGGFAAVCLNTCSATALTSGIHVVLGRRER